MRVRRKRIQQLANELLKTAGVERPPVPVERIAKLQGVKIVKAKMPDSNVSGFVVKKGPALIIGVNSSHAPARQQFTIAHELGHVMLHSPAAEQWHVDRMFDVKFRDERSSLGIDIEEREANSFAAELLMPRAFVAADLEDVEQLDVEDRLISKLANRYRVSMQAMLVRLNYLGYVSQ